MIVEEHLHRLTGIVESLASSVVAHDNQIDALIKLAEKHEAALANLERPWQAHISALPKQ